ncbi:hypothetical protein GCM10027053_03850 [Intrasporangium mesophilum]
MSTRVYDGNGTLAQLWDDTARTYTDFSTEADTVRPYTAQENARADAEASAASADVNRATIEQALADALAGLDVIIAKTPAQVTGSDTKELARDLRRVIRLLIRRFDGTA